MRLGGRRGGSRELEGAQGRLRLPSPGLLSVRPPGLPLGAPRELALRLLRRKARRLLQLQLRRLLRGAPPLRRLLLRERRRHSLRQLRRLAPLALARAALLRGARRAPARRRCGRREAYFHRHNISPACWRALPRANDVDDEGLPRQEARRHRRLEVPPGPRVLKLYLHARTDASRHDDAHPLGALRPRVSLGGGGAPGAAAAAARASGASAGRSAKDALHGAREMPVSPFRRGATRRPPRR
mmetsp:Transcript_25562/g.76157  ORF Transcript_25562/g.76157 Transcript_25562/m.76157 type:complete len:242 (-) Transcript_25562:42-767(-)